MNNKNKNYPWILWSLGPHRAMLPFSRGNQNLLTSSHHCSQERPDVFLRGLITLTAESTLDVGLQHMRVFYLAGSDHKSPPHWPFRRVPGIPLHTVRQQKSNWVKLAPSVTQELGRIPSSNRREIHQAAEREKFAKAERGWKKESIHTECIVSGEVAFLRGIFLRIRLPWLPFLPSPSPQKKAKQQHFSNK